MPPPDVVGDIFLPRYKLGLTNLEFTLGVAQPTFVTKFPENVYIPRSLRVRTRLLKIVIAESLLILF